MNRPFKVPLYERQSWKGRRSFFLFFLIFQFWSLFDNLRLLNQSIWHILVPMQICQHTFNSHQAQSSSNQSGHFQGVIQDLFMECSQDYSKHQTSSRFYLLIYLIQYSNIFLIRSNYKLSQHAFVFITVSFKPQCMPKVNTFGVDLVT